MESKISRKQLTLRQHGSVGSLNTEFQSDLDFDVQRMASKTVVYKRNSKPISIFPKEMKPFLYLDTMQDPLISD